jgi:uncharacterized repeat protein (TIGR01451 family)
MCIFMRTGAGGRGSRGAAFALRGLAAAILLAMVPAARAAAQVPIVDVVTNRATATYRGPEGSPGEAAATSVVTLRRTVGVALAPPRSAAIAPGGRRVLAHTLTNRGNGRDRFLLAAAAPAGWTVALHADVDGDGMLSAADSIISTAVEISAGRAVAVLLVADAPADAAEGTAVQVDVSAVSQALSSVRASIRDRLDVRVLLPRLQLSKSVDRPRATRGDTLTYTLSFGNDGTAATGELVLADTLPEGLRHVPGTVRMNGAAVPDAGIVASVGGREVLTFSLGALEPGASGTVSFRAEVGPGAGSLRNVAVLSGGDEVPVASGPVVTELGAPSLQLSKTHDGGDAVGLGDAIVFRIRASNASSEHLARTVVISDTVPVGLVPVSAGSGGVIQGQVVTWAIGDLRAGAAVEVEVTARVTEEARDHALINRAVAVGLNVEAVTASSLALRVEAQRPGVLGIAKSAGALEAGLGEAVPFVLTLRNRGLVPISGMTIHDELPAGMRLVREGITGADFVAEASGTVRFHVAGPLAPGAEHTVRYSAVIANAPRGAARLGNRAHATGAGGLVRTDTAVAWVRVRRGNAMESRTLLGKVWVDRDGDGRQGAGEAGLSGVEVWSADGQVVTTDREGRFSFADLRRGSHVLRLDTLSLPAGTRIAPGDASVRVNADGWTTPTLSFRVVPRGDAPPAPMAGGGGMPAPPLDPVAAAMVAPARSSEERRAEEAQAFVMGPPVRIASPADGVVLTSNRLNVRLRGEAGAQARLYLGERLVGEGVLRPDGTFDFAGIQVERGPGRLRAWMKNSFGNERWDSVSIHRTGAAARLERVDERPVVMHAESRELTTLPVRVLDQWGVPVADRPQLAVEAAGAAFGGTGARQQVRARVDGIAEVPLRAGTGVGTGEAVVTIGQAELRVPFTVLPSDRPLIATGAVQLGVGAAPESYGAMTMRGSLGEKTAVSVTYDSRRTDPQSEFFGRGYDPSEDARYPTLGDESDRRTYGAATQALSARVEHGLDWMELGDIRTGEFSGSERLGGYGRSLTGAMGRVGTGAVVWRAFGSMTDQALAQSQLRADGTTGPFRFGGAVRPGTDRLAVEVRARDNAARLLRREELVRYFDYQIDYRTGEVMLSRAVPSQDGMGNPIFVVALMERRSGGEARFVGGLRMETNAARLLPRLGADSMNVALFGVHDAVGAGDVPGAAELFGAEMRIRRGGLQFGGEVIRSRRPDSASVAGQAHLRWELPGERVALTAEWLHVGEGFASAMNPRLRSGLEELRLGTELRLVADARLRLQHERQEFHEFGVRRQHTTLSAERKVAGRRVSAEAGLLSDAQQAGTSSMALGTARLALSESTEMWLEGSRQMQSAHEGGSLPDQVGLGISQALIPGLRAEGTWRWARQNRDSAAYMVSGLNLKTDLGMGARAWGGVERIDAGEVAHAAVLGWNQRLTLRDGWTVNALVERHMGLSRAPLADPVRALPFAQPERERWSGALGVDILPATGARLGYRGEFHDGELRTGWRFDLSGDVSLGRSGALLTRHDWMEDVRKDGPLDQLTRSERSMVGLAVRPARNDAWNVLAKLEWRYAYNPLASTVLDGSRREERLIAATDAIWAPVDGLSFATRYAVRRTMARDTAAGAGTLRSLAHYVGGRVERDVVGQLRARMDARLLVEGMTGAQMWSAAPSLTLGLVNGLEVEGGYRFGTLEDADFARNGQKGFFAVLGMRFTEGTAASIADFWKERVFADDFGGAPARVSAPPAAAPALPASLLPPVAPAPVQAARKCGAICVAPALERPIGRIAALALPDSAAHTVDASDASPRDLPTRVAAAARGSGTPVRGRPAPAAGVRSTDRRVEEVRPESTGDERGQPHLPELPRNEASARPVRRAVVGGAAGLLMSGLLALLFVAQRRRKGDGVSGPRQDDSAAAGG